MSLESLIQSGGYQSATEAYTAIMTPSVEVRDTQLYTWAGVADIIGPEAAEGLRVAFDSNGLGWVSLQLGGLGLPLSDVRVQQALLGFAQAGVPGCSALATKGVSMKAPWEVANLSGAPTQDQVAKAWIVWNTRQQMAEDLISVVNPIRAKSTALNAWLDSLDVSAKTVAEVQAYCDQLLASPDGNPVEVTP